MTERAAVSAARLRGHGDEKAADQAAVDAMRRELNKLPIDGTVVIGEGERDEAPMLFIGEKVGNRPAPRSTSRSIRWRARRSAPRTCRTRSPSWRWPTSGTLLHAPDIYMDKIAIGPGYPEGRHRPRRAARREHHGAGQGQGREARRDHRLILLDRPRHAEIIEAVRKTGARGPA